MANMGGKVRVETAISETSQQKKSGAMSKSGKPQHLLLSAPEKPQAPPTKNNNTRLRLLS
jgi:hypothetical protein